MADKAKVLVIDDDPAINESVQAVLEAAGFETRAALNGKDGVAAFESYRPDIVLCDMMMESMDAGIVVASAIRKERPDVPIFLLSTIGDATAQNVEVDKIGFSGVFQKPVNFDLLLTVMSRLARPK